MHDLLVLLDTFQRVAEDMKLAVARLTSTIGMVKADAAGVSLSDEAVQASCFQPDLEKAVWSWESVSTGHVTFWIKGLDTMLQTLFNHRETGLGRL